MLYEYNVLIHDTVPQDVVVDTPQQVQYSGKRVATSKVCGVSILRAGETMEPALCAVCKDVSMGKILIQTNLDTGEPEVSQCTSRASSLQVEVMKQKSSSLCECVVVSDNIAAVSTLYLL